MSRTQRKKETKIVGDGSTKNLEVVKQNSVFGKFSELEMIACLKELALDPCKPRFVQGDIEPFRAQILTIRKVMVLKDSEIPWRKRKLEQFVNGEVTVPSVPNQSKLCKKKSSHASSRSGLLNSDDSVECNGKKILFGSHSTTSLLTFEDTLREKEAISECSPLDDIVQWDLAIKDISLAVDSDESIIGSNLMSPENPSAYEPPSLEIDSTVQKSLTFNKPNWRYLRPARQSIRLLNSVGEHSKVVPVGPRFQVEVPAWSYPKNINIASYNSDSNTTKWLGTRVWPIQIGNAKSSRTIGKGRPKSCCCVTSESADCIRLHICEERQRLEYDLGPAFFSWKFDEMGEQVSNSWTLKEQRIFQSVMRAKQQSYENSFLRQALKRLLNKNRRDVIDYYFNVYIPQRMGLQTRSSPLKQVDTDDEDGAEDFNSTGSKTRCKGKMPTVSKAKDVKAQYLRHSS